MVWLFLVSVAVLSLVVWTSRRVPRPFVPPAEPNVAATSPAPKAVTPAPSPLAQTHPPELRVSALRDAPPPIPGITRADATQAGRDADEVPRLRATFAKKEKAGNHKE